MIIDLLLFQFSDLIFLKFDNHIGLLPSLEGLLNLLIFLLLYLEAKLANKQLQFFSLVIIVNFIIHMLSITVLIAMFDEGDKALELLFDGAIQRSLNTLIRAISLIKHLEVAQFGFTKSQTARRDITTTVSCFGVVALEKHFQLAK